MPRMVDSSIVTEPSVRYRERRETIASYIRSSKRVRIMETLQVAIENRAGHALRGIVTLPGAED